MNPINGAAIGRDDNSTSYLQYKITKGKLNKRVSRIRHNRLWENSNLQLYAYLVKITENSGLTNFL